MRGTVAPDEPRDQAEMTLHPCRGGNKQKVSPRSCCPCSLGNTPPIIMTCVRLSSTPWGPQITFLSDKCTDVIRRLLHAKHFHMYFSQRMPQPKPTRYILQTRRWTV